jgi:hypothetical protein
MQDTSKLSGAALAAYKHRPREEVTERPQYGGGCTKKRLSDFQIREPFQSTSRDEDNASGRDLVVNRRAVISSTTASGRARPLGSVCIRGRSDVPVATIRVYPSGVKVQWRGLARHGRPMVKRPRGQITRFSAGTSGRLRKFAMERTVVGRKRYGITLTTQRQLSAREFAVCLVALKKWCDSHEIRAVIRRALQKRGAEHVHGLFYLASAAEGKLIRARWLKITGESDDLDARRRSVVVKSLATARDEGAMIAYVCRPGERPVTNGKHWTVWGRQHFSPITPREFDVNMHELDVFRRGYEGLIIPRKAKKRRRRHLPRLGNWRRFGSGADGVRLAEYAGAKEVEAAVGAVVEVAAVPVVQVPADVIVPAADGLVTAEFTAVFTAPAVESVPAVVAEEAPAVAVEAHGNGASAGEVAGVPVMPAPAVVPEVEIVAAVEVESCAGDSLPTVAIERPAAMSVPTGRRSARIRAGMGRARVCRRRGGRSEARPRRRRRLGARVGRRSRATKTEANVMLVVQVRPAVIVSAVMPTAAGAAGIGTSAVVMADRTPTLASIGGGDYVALAGIGMTVAVRCRIVRRTGRRLARRRVARPLRWRARAESGRRVVAGWIVRNGLARAPPGRARAAAVRPVADYDPP